ncbi:MAG: metallophosphoesterase [DPANN group archaeon]|nr:metallophosphoesterase [DPANN group archaeon]
MDQAAAIKALIQLGQLPTSDKIRELTSGLQHEEPELLGLKTSESRIKIENKNSSVEILQHFDWKPKKVTVQDFTAYFRKRYEYMKNLLMSRAETENATSISKLSSMAGKTTIVGMISDIRKLPTGTVKLALEDLSGTTDAIISVKNPELAKKIPFLAPDEVLAFKGSIGRGIFFVDDIIWPDIPIKQRQNCPEEVYAAFTGDIHSGSNMFLPKEFEKFIQWLKGDYGDEKMKNIAKKTKYIFVLGDLIDGVGIYPEQEKELHIKDAAGQYDLLAKYFSEIPDDKHIIVIPGNHDALRLCEPQPTIPKDLAAPLYKLPNVINVSNPAMLKLHKQDDYPGFDVLMYHGYSFDHFVDTVEALRLAGGYDAPDKIWEFLLKRRHLAPTYGATLALPMDPDPLTIRQVPDLVASGHIHKAGFGNYKNVLSVSCSCWQSRTNFQVRVGHKPEPAIIPVYGLHNGKAMMMEFI